MTDKFYRASDTLFTTRYHLCLAVHGWIPGVTLTHSVSLL